MVELFQNYFSFLQDNVPLIAGTFIVTVVWLMSGCCASTISELRKRGQWLHLFLGLLIPWLYPLVIFFTMTVKRKEGEDGEEEASEHADGAPPPKKVPGIAAGVDEDELNLEEEESSLPEWNPQRLKEMSTDLEGNPRGPFVFLLANGHEQRAERIVDALPMAVVIEIIDFNEKSQRLRIPYTDIENCTEL